MKKIFSIVCACLVMMGANAAKAPQKVQTMVGDPTYFTSQNLNGTGKYGVGDFNLYFYDDNDNIVAVMDLNTGSDQSVVGRYKIGDGKFFGAYFWIEVGGKQYEANYGALSISCIGTKEVDSGNGILTCPEYEIVATNWYDATNDILVSFTGKAYSIAQKKSDGSFYMLGDSKINATEIVLNNYVEINNDSIWYWTLFAQDMTCQYALDMAAISNDIAETYYFASGVYDISGEQLQNIQFTADGGKNWMTPTQFYGTMLENEKGSYDFNFYTIVGGTVYHLISGDTDPVPPSEDYSADENSDFMATFNNVQWDTNYFQSNGVVYLDADGDIDATKAIALAFFPSALDPNTVLPIGTYQISRDFTTGTAAASTGYSGGYYNQCFAYTASNNSYDKLWFIVSGSINVSRTLQGTTIIVNGQNSKGKNVNVTIISNSTPIENVEAEKVVSKRIENGQVIIRRNGVDYNMMGVAF